MFSAPLPVMPLGPLDLVACATLLKWVPYLLGGCPANNIFRGPCQQLLTLVILKFATGNIAQLDIKLVIDKGELARIIANQNVKFKDTSQPKQLSIYRHFPETQKLNP